MKTTTLPSIRVEPEFRAAVESVLEKTETLSEFVEQAVRDSVLRRAQQAEFVARGLRSLEAATQNEDYVDASDVLDELRRRLDVARGRTSSGGSAA